MKDNTGLKKILWLPALALAAGCASIGNPSGGARDEEPPRYTHSTPEMGATNFKGEKIDIYFNELVNVKDAFSKVVVSPPGASTPRVASQGRKVTVTFPDSLLPNTTYTIDFANAIEDNNESNKLENFSFVFSTGEKIDSLRIAGMVLQAETLEPIQGKLVGIHSNLSDSAFRTSRFDRIARTDDRGRFCIFGVAPGKYRVYAIDDTDGDLRYSSPEEEIAFYDVTVAPTTRQGFANDTIFNMLTGAVDTIQRRARTIYLPNDILLRSFTSAFKQQYLTKYERVDTTRLSFLFNSPSLTAPEFKVVGAPKMKDWYIRESSPTNDSVTLWLRPRSLVGTDTLRIAATYMRTDSAMNLREFTDTLRFTFDRRKFERTQAQQLKNYIKKMKQSHDDTTHYALPEPTLDIRSLSSSTHDVYLPLELEVGVPLERFDTSGAHLEYMKDTVWTELPLPPIVTPDSLRPRNMRIEHPWTFDTRYRLRVDSAAMEDIYGHLNKAFIHEFSTRKQDDYSSLKLRISGLDPQTPAFVQVLNSDKPVRTVAVENGVAYFPYMMPGKYYVRLYEDFNGNGKYDPGDFDAGLQPDMVYYYPKAITLKKNWDKDQDWNVFATAIDLQKPEAIRKVRPTATKGQRTTAAPDDEEEE